MSARRKTLSANIIRKKKILSAKIFQLTDNKINWSLNIIFYIHSFLSFSLSISFSFKTIKALHTF
ncbi:unnamed protein product [Meloidogyne enterolobii]|uniref:Uncharacterized protein n=1 Tax=Meloidogyne enterolobii TaxID=390850 RepID=A0ACB0YG98_MELEN